MGSISTWDELRTSTLAVCKDTLQLDTAYTLIRSYSDGKLFRYPGLVWFFSDVYDLPDTADDDYLRSGEPVVSVVIGRPVSIRNRPKRHSAIELGLVKPDEAPWANRTIHGLCVPLGNLSGISLPRNTVAAA